METERSNTLPPQVVIKYSISGQESFALINQFPFMIGRDISAVDLVLMHRTVSRIHARLSSQDGVVLLENVSTTNRTTINGRYIDSPAEIHTGDKVTMGACQLTIEIARFYE